MKWLEQYIAETSAHYAHEQASALFSRPARGFTPQEEHDLTIAIRREQSMALDKMSKVLDKPETAVHSKDE